LGGLANEETSNVSRKRGADRAEPTILVVEDDRALLELIQQRLREHGHQTDGVTTGTAALAWLENHTARLMLLDYVLPDLLGDELLQQLHDRGCAVPFIVATGHGSEAVAVDMMKRGARDYLVKGASFMRLLPAVIDQTLARLQQEERLAQAESELRRSEQRLRQAHRELEERVRQRTAELAEANVRLRVEMEERRRAEEQSRQHLAELAHVGRLSTVGEMVAELAHELNQPLTSIATYAEVCLRLLQSGLQSNAAQLQAAIKQVSEQAERAGEIIRRLRRFTAKGTPLHTIVNINEVVGGIARLVDVEARTARVEMHFDLTEPIPSVAADCIQIEQVLVNLLRNAFEAMRDAQPQARELTVRTSTGDAERIEVSVCDTGVGPPAGDIEQMLQRFFTTKPGGMGMGLSISRSIIESHGGRLWATRNPDRGTTFHFTLPIHHFAAPG
jgi:C4-dicarboxylate-specific signal transduction histidine kinase